MTKRPTIRTVLLGAVAVAALGGTVAAPSLMSSYPAHAAQIAGQPAPTEIAPGSFADVVDRVSPAVVSVKVKMVDNSSTDDNAPQGMPNIPKGDPLERFFHQFEQRGGGAQRQHPHTGMAQGSGFLISSDGYIVTNNHVVENATDVEVAMQDGKLLPATVVGTDKKTDLALLKLKSGSNYAYVQWAGSVPRVGDWVIAVGNPFGLGGTVTAGIVSARGRDIGAGPYDDFLQIDAPVNRGNSGGPTFNVEGQVVGINTAIFSPSGGSVGIGFAIPTEVAKGVIQDLKDKGVVARGWLGIQIQPVTADIADSLGLKDTKGALVAEPQKNSPAGQAGIMSGDVITAVNNESVDGPKELSRKIASIGPDKKVGLTVWHEGSEKTVDVMLGTLPNDMQAKAETTPPKDEKSQLSSLGLTLAPAASIAGAGKDGVVVADIDPEGVAAQKGLQTGDVILEAAGRAVSKPSDVSSAMADAKKDGRKAVLLRVKSGDNVRYVALATPNAG
jgi:serine protease Do